MIVVNEKITIAEEELLFSAIRAGGPGGQHVNKVSTAICLKFDYRQSPSLPDALKRRLDALPDQRISKDGVITINAREHRSQEANRRSARSRLTELLRELAIERKRRIRTKPPAAAKEKRIADKHRRSKVKAARGIPDIE